jgi:hydrogenase nickel incorporation protein HypA/HybF
MRELTLTQILLDTALENANSRRILNITLLIGPFSEEREESIRFYWRDLAKGTPGEGAKLNFEHINAEPRCLACGGTMDLEDNQSLCRFCQNDRSQVFGGDEVRLERVVIE